MEDKDQEQFYIWVGQLNGDDEIRNIHPEQVKYVAEQARDMWRHIERKRVIEQVRKWAKDYCRNNGDYSAVGAINDLLEDCLDKLESGEE
jgi:hypothetical protein